jgi:Spy/CpxP family protein refolding chaperone
MTRFIVIFGFAISFAAGLVVGMGKQWNPPAEAGSPSPTTHPSGPPHGFLPAALNLTPDQQDKMKKIWQDEAERGRHEQFDRRNQCRKERDDAILSLLSPQQKTQYDDIQKTYREKNDAIDQEFRAEFQRKVEQTKEILTPEQRVKYDELLARRQSFDRGPRDRGDRGFRDSNRRGGDDHATSQPRSQP